MVRRHRARIANPVSPNDARENTSTLLCIQSRDRPFGHLVCPTLSIHTSSFDDLPHIRQMLERRRRNHHHHPQSAMRVSPHSNRTVGPNSHIPGSSSTYTEHSHTFTCSQAYITHYTPGNDQCVLCRWVEDCSGRSLREYRGLSMSMCDIYTRAYMHIYE